MELQQNLVQIKVNKTHERIHNLTSSKIFWLKSMQATKSMGIM